MLLSTSKLQDKLLDDMRGIADEIRREAFISKRLAGFWRDAFGWKKSGPRPSLEDHFTQLDLAANAGHYLGGYSPKKLRALRRMTIHRIFRLLDIEPVAAPHVDRFMTQLTANFAVSIVTTNWDIMAERCLERQGISTIYGHTPDLRDAAPVADGLPVWKLHGSGNWGYCDLCRNLITSELGLGKIAPRFGWLLEPDDFRLFRGGGTIVSKLGSTFRECVECRGRVAARVATFSYRKHLDVPFFHSIWDEARNGLRRADRWLFVGYSLPEADVEIRHLLKTAELAHNRPKRPRIDVVLKDDLRGQERYQRLFGTSITTIRNDGLQAWVTNRLPDYR